ncbi:26S proteasome subunit RPN7-domain-containing protein [Coprinopsis sp. MPI-PUGE-AT-0042]|nr:26S proteasome subunit RPN7-domain-containing protein [Coprinopsis sp. MPI-PUGE-AT-0042]
MERLTHITLTCPSVALEAFQLAVHRSRDPSPYPNLLSAYEQSASNSNATGGPGLPNPHGLAQLDTKSMDEAIARYQSERTKLEVERKAYTNNTIKESIRMAHGDLGNVYRDLGDYAESLKHCTKSHEFCTASQHVLDVCLSVLELLIDQRNYSHLTTYVFKADAASDSAKAAAAPPSAAATASVTAVGAAQQKKKAAPDGEREGVQAKLSLATTLSHLGQGIYEKAANSLLNVGSPSNLVDWIGKLVAPGDITIYTTLCAPATFPRASIKSRLLENTNFSLYMEHEPTSGTSSKRT